MLREKIVQQIVYSKISIALQLLNFANFIFDLL